MVQNTFSFLSTNKKMDSIFRFQEIRMMTTTKLTLIFNDIFQSVQLIFFVDLPGGDPTPSPPPQTLIACHSGGKLNQYITIINPMMPMI
ncbi:hypothetical protein BLOT_002805 [Blomia tropicalis]|nr:hypothetical protein BLOT_002805 [Blomia tropicalis]